MIAARARLVRRRQGLAIVVATLVLAFAVAWAHSGMAMDHMTTPAAVCLAVLDGALLMAAAVVRPPALAPSRLLAVPPTRLAVAAPRIPRYTAQARAGPSLLQVFRL